MAGERTQGRVFGEYAQEYERLRFGYPDALVDDVLEYACLDGAPVVEVGAGTGKATVSFAARVNALVAVEPDPAMAAILARRCQAWPQVTIDSSTFEEYRPPAQPFGLLISAQAWHWIDPAIRWGKAATVLAEGGALALFWNRPVAADPAVRAMARRAYLEYGLPPDSHDPVPEDLASTWPYPELAGLPQFGDLACRGYESIRSLTGEDYVAGLSTESAYRMLDAPVRQRLSATLLERVGARVEMRVSTMLYLARRGTRRDG